MAFDSVAGFPASISSSAYMLDLNCRSKSLVQLALMEKYERPPPGADAAAEAAAPETSAMPQEEALAIIQARTRRLLRRS